MSSEDSDPRVPAWAEVARREAFFRPRAQPSRADRKESDRWLDEPWEDLAGRLAGQSANQEGRRRRQTGESDWSWRTGADGEFEIAEVIRQELVEPRGLRSLGRRRGRWHLLSSIPLGDRGGDLDLLLIGPPGIAVINAKKHVPRARVEFVDGEVWVAGHRTRHIQTALNDVRHGRRLLSTAIDAFLVRTQRGTCPAPWRDLLPYRDALQAVPDLSSPNAPGLTRAPVFAALAFAAGAPPTTIYGPPLLAQPRALCRVLSKDYPAILDEEQIDGVYELARRSTVWHRKVTY